MLFAGMSARGSGVLCLAVLSFLLVSVRASDLEDEYLDRFKTMFEGIRKLTDYNPMLAEASEAKDMVSGGSREELEEDKGQTDASASQEGTPKAEADDDDDDDSDEVEDALMNPVRGITSLFGLHDIFTRSKPWWMGPDVCVEREEKEDKDEETPFGDLIAFGSAQFSNCLNSPDKYTCKTITRRNGVTKTSIVTYQCCHGFRRTRASSNCTKVETKPVIELAEDLGAERFVDLVKSAGVENELKGKVTIFLPTDSALHSHHGAMDSLNAVDPILTNEVPETSGSAPHDQKGLVMGHIVDGVYQTSDFDDEQVLTTKANTTLRINFLPNRGGITVNCVRLNQTDKLTENGVVHTLESVLEPAKENLASILSDEKFSKFRELLEENGLWELMSRDKALTVFAVENEGVEKIAGRHKMCMKNVLAHHILPHTLCSAMGDSGERLATLDLARGWLPFTSQDGEMTIGNGTKVTLKDRIATNGLLHVAEGFVIPSGGRAVSELLNQTEHKEWLSVLEKSGLLGDIESTPNMTMFVPTNQAVQDAELDGMSQEELQDIVKYHVGNAQDGNTVSTLLQGQNLTITTEKSSFPGLVMGRWGMSVQCSPIRRVGGRVCNGLLHEISSILRPPTKSVFELIQSTEGLEKLRKILQGTKLEEELKSGLDAPVTFLAPSDSAFEGIKTEDLDELTNDKEAADRLLRSHVLKEAVCCSNAVPGSWPFSYSSPTLAAGRPAEISRRGQTAIFGSLPATDCDNLAKDGILHIVDGLRLPRQRQHQPDREFIIRRPNSEIILTGL